MVYLFYILLSAPIWYWTYLGFTGGLGADPLDTLNDQTGYVTLTLILINLWLGVGIRFLKGKFKPLRWWYQRRRAFGVASGLYAILHFLCYLGNEGLEAKAWEQIVTKTYLTAASIALTILILLTLTSNDFSIRKLKAKRWKQLHRFIHVASIFILIHVLLIEKGNIPLLLAMTIPIMPFQIWRLAEFARSKLSRKTE
jgi:sulfoxide reductase heme-binding subunit YedZ